MAKHPTEKFPVESPGVIPGQEMTVQFQSRDDRHIMVIATRCPKLGYVYLTGEQLQEIVALADGRIVNRINLPNESKSGATDDQLMAMLRKHETRLANMVHMAGYGNEAKLCGDELWIAWASMVLALRLLRAQKIEA